MHPGSVLMVICNRTKHQARLVVEPFAVEYILEPSEKIEIHDIPSDEAIELELTEIGFALWTSRRLQVWKAGKPLPPAAG